MPQKFCQEITNKEVWEGLLDKCEEKTFLQSWNWGEFQRKMGNKIWRLGVCDNNGGPTSIILAVKVEAKRGTFLLVQHGPVIENPKSEIRNPKQIQNSKFQILNTFFEELRKIAKKEGCGFIRVAPLLPAFAKASAGEASNEEIFKKLGFIRAPMHANAYKATWKLDLTPSEDELLKGMRKTTRYLIRQAEKNPDIAIEKSPAFAEATAGKDLEIYQKLNKEVAKRQNFSPFSDEYIKNELDVFSKYGEVMLFLGKYKGEAVAGALIIFWSGIGFYHQAASLAKYAKFSIPYLLQWEAIKEAKRRGCKIYDFWGYVDPQKYPKHPWAGPTLFKMGFGGRAYEYVKTQDLPISRKYWLIYIFEKLRKIKRGL